jgi:hypothetical protein
MLEREKTPLERKIIARQKIYEDEAKTYYDSLEALGINTLVVNIITQPSKMPIIIQNQVQLLRSMGGKLNN